MFRRLGIKIAFNLIEKLFLAKIKNPEINSFVEASLSPSKRIIDVLTDKNPENEEQLLQIWREENDKLAEPAFDVIRALLIAKIQDQGIREDLLVVLEELEGNVIEHISGPNK